MAGCIVFIRSKVIELGAWIGGFLEIYYWSYLGFCSSFCVRLIFTFFQHSEKGEIETTSF